MYVRALEAFGACCASCTNGGSCAGGRAPLSGMTADDYKFWPGETIYDYIARITKMQQAFIEIQKNADAQTAAAAIEAAKAKAASSPAGQATIPQPASVSAMSASTKLLLVGAATIGILMLMRRR